ncbi:MAG: zf-HC2 domain-containing protein [Acidobacteriia bacterium]|nr:zf-HC2 domain-containing protein [Terriglobia bacterium]
MHGVLTDRLEEYLAGTLEPVARRQFEAHLNTCAPCREEVQGMQELSDGLAFLRPDQSIAPSPSFYAGIMERIGRQNVAPTFTGLLSWRFAFGRRMAFASLLVLAVLGSYLWLGERVYTAGPTPEAVMAQQESPAFESRPAQDNMLVTLTAYEH